MTPATQARRQSGDVEIALGTQRAFPATATAMVVVDETKRPGLVGQGFAHITGELGRGVDRQPLDTQQGQRVAGLQQALDNTVLLPTEDPPSRRRSESGRLSTAAKGTGRREYRARLIS